MPGLGNGIFHHNSATTLTQTALETDIRLNILIYLLTRVKENKRNLWIFKFLFHHLNINCHKIPNYQMIEGRKLKSGRRFPQTFSFRAQMRQTNIEFFIIKKLFQLPKCHKNVEISYSFLFSASIDFFILLRQRPVLERGFKIMSRLGFAKMQSEIGSI